MDSIKSIEKNQYLNRRFVTIQLNETVGIIDYQVDMINNNLGNGLLYIEKKQFNDQVQLEYEVTDLIPLKEYINMENVNGTMLLSLFKNMLSVISSLQNYLLNRSNILINKDYVYIDLSKKIVAMLYIPCRNDLFDIEQDFRILAKDIALECLIANNVDKQKFTDKILTLVNSNSYSLLEIEKSLNNTAASATITESQVSNITSEQKPSIQDEKKKGLFSSLFSSKGKDKTLIKSHNTEQFMQDLNLSKQEIVTQVSYETEVLIDNSNYLVFIKDSSIYKAKINKNIFVIGRNKEQSDYVIENPSVGKKHAKIISNKNVDKLVDLNSKNGTFLNGKRLIAEKEYLLKNGDEIVFGNAKAQYKKM